MLSRGPRCGRLVLCLGTSGQFCGKKVRLGNILGLAKLLQELTGVDGGFIGLLMCITDVKSTEIVVKPGGHGGK